MRSSTGCGTGYFTRRFALDGHPVTGIDPEPSMLKVARAHRAAGERYVRGGAGAYRGAHWHSAREVRELLSRWPGAQPELRFGVFLPSGGLLARAVERAAPARMPLGGFLAVAASVLIPADR